MNTIRMMMAMAITGVSVCLATGAERAAAPADGKMALTDYGSRDWGPELVRYAVNTQVFVPGQLALIGPDGKAVPFQVEEGVLAFVANVPSNQTAVYRLEKSGTDRSAENGALTCRADAAGIEMANEHLAVRLPPVGARTFEPAEAAAKATPPLLQWKAAGTDWIGASSFATKRAVASQAFRLVRQGPACVEFEARYTFSPKGAYVVRVRMSPGVPMAAVTEEFDMGEVTSGEDFLVLDLHKGWQPNQVAWVPGASEQLLPALEKSSLAACLEARRKTASAAAPVGGVGEPPVINPPEKGWLPLDRIVPGGKWGGLKGGVQVWEGELEKPGTGRNIGLVPLHVGSWRRSMALMTWYRDGDGLAVGLPLSVRPIRWCFEVTDDFSPFSTHEHDDGLPRTYGRREWGLWVGPGLETAQPRLGHIGLDRYKDWILEWPVKAAAGKDYPGGFFEKSQVERLRGSLDQHPAADVLRGRYLLTGKTEDAVRNAREVIEKLKRPYQENDFFIPGLSNYRKSQLLVFVNEAEDALACPELPDDLRRELRRRLALYAYVTSDPDWNPRGAGVHLGNNNMPINRTLALAYFAGLLPDHPRYAYWMACVKTFTDFKLATQYSPAGEALECPTYSTYAPAGALNIAQNVLRNRGFGDLATNGVTRRNLEYMANLTMPDPRFGGARIIPGMGNSANDQDSIWGVSVATFLPSDPAFAGWCKAMFTKAGAKFGPISTGVTFTGHPMYYLPDVPETPVAFKTIFMPAYGVAFRAHAGTPDEVSLLLRAGCNWGHWDTDALNVILYGKGAPLSPGTGYQYYFGAGTQKNAIYHNRVKVGARDQQEIFGRVDATVADYGLGDNADYAVAERYYPPEVFADKQGEMTWNRHVVFLKGRTPSEPSYAVLRDTFLSLTASGPGARRDAWWTWMNLGMPDRVSVDGAAFASNAAPVEQVLEEKDMAVKRGQVLELATDYGASTWMWFPEPHDVRVRGVVQYGASHGARETKTILELPAGREPGYLCVLFPRKDGEKPPVCERLAEGAVCVKSEASTDYVFADDNPFSYKKGDVVFTGKAGAVRVYADRVALCLNAGTGRVGYKGMVFEGPGPFEKVVALKDLKRGVTAIEGGYEKKPQVVEIGKGIRVRGEGPFEAALDGETIRIRTQGRARVLHVDQPPFIVRPRYWIDGRETMASWTDYPASGWGSYRNTWLMALPVPDGTHELVVKDFVFPPVWERPFVPLIDATPLG